MKQNNFARTVIAQLCLNTSSFVLKITSNINVTLKQIYFRQVDVPTTQFCNAVKANILSAEISLNKHSAHTASVIRALFFTSALITQ